MNDCGLQYWQQQGQNEMLEMWEQMLKNEQFLKEYNETIDRCENEYSQEVTAS